MVNVVALNGSPRGRRGNTRLILDPFLRGLHDRNAQVRLLHLADLDIRSCSACDACWDKTPGRCGIDDDMQTVLRHMRDADVWVFATGLYTGGSSGLLKNVLDRMLAMAGPFVPTADERSHSKARFRPQARSIVLVSTCTDWELDAFELLREQVSLFCDQLGCDFAGALLRPHALALPTLLRANEANEVAERVVLSARQLGQQFADSKTLSKDILSSVAAELMNREVYDLHLERLTQEIITRPIEREQSRAESHPVLPTPTDLRALFSEQGEIGDRILAALMRMASAGPNANAEYQRAVASLSTSANLAVEAVIGAYDFVPVASYTERWMLVHLIAELEHPSALAALNQIVAAPMPTDPESDGCLRFSPYMEECMVRLAAIAGVRRLGRLPNGDAAQSLLDHARHEDEVVAREATFSYLELTGPSGREALRKVLPIDRQWFLDLRRVDSKGLPAPLIFDVTSSPLEDKKPSLSSGSERGGFRSGRRFDAPPPPRE